MILRRLVFLFLLLNGTLGLSGQVSGYVFHDGEAVPGATVQVKNSEFGTVSDPNGYFVLNSALPKDAVLVVRSVGFKQQEKQINNKASIRFDLEVSDLGLDAVVVTGTMKPTMITASPVKVEVITSKHLNTYIPAAASSIMEGVKLINGIHEVVACGVCFTNSISINGLPGPYTAVLIDGKEASALK